MRKIFFITTLILASSSFAEQSCESLSGDFVTICKQNEQILRKLNSLRGPSLKACTVTYCVSKTWGDITSASSCSDSGGGAQRTLDIEATNRVQAREKFPTKYNELFDKNYRPLDLDRSIVDVYCD